MTPRGNSPPAREVAALLLLTFVTGMVDAASFLGLGHVFTANMTGNVVFLGFAAAGMPDLSVWRSCTSILAFLCGAVAGGCWKVRMANGSRSTWLGAAVAVEVLFLLLAAAASYGFATGALPDSRIYAVIVTTALAMGLRNATVRAMAVPDMTTTVLTLTLTGLASDSSLAGGTNPGIGRRTGSLLAMFTGALTGALLLQSGVSAALAVSALVSAGAGVLFAKRA